MIDKEKVREAVELLRGTEKKKPINILSALYDAKDIIFNLAEMYLSEKLVEPMSKEEIEKIIKELLSNAGLCIVEINGGAEVKSDFLAEALVGKIGKEVK